MAARRQAKTWRQPRRLQDEEAEVRGAAPQPLQALRPAAGYMRKFALCRLCFRELALQGDIAGVVKSSW